MGRKKKGGNSNQDFQTEAQGRKISKVVSSVTNITGSGSGGVNFERDLEGNRILSVIDGPGDDELNGLEIEERKRKRIGPVEVVESEMVDSTNIMDSVFSKTDYTESSNTFLAQLAMQASQPQ